MSDIQAQTTLDLIMTVGGVLALLLLTYIVAKHLLARHGYNDDGEPL